MKIVKTIKILLFTLIIISCGKDSSGEEMLYLNLKLTIVQKTKFQEKKRRIILFDSNKRYV